MASGWLLIAAAGCCASNVSPTAGPGNRRRRRAQPANRLAKETSPYLLLHAHNPVDWYPWGPEAFAKARAEKKPIFLSIGYSSCYWCHVMERESFTDPEIARFLNEHFVSIKVDREERPDVDQVYMAALQAFSTGGWPMSMFLLPDGRPFFGATYLPPRDRDGFSGFLTLLRGIDKAWRHERAEIERAAERPDGDRQAEAGRLQPTAASSPITGAVVAEGRRLLAEQFDPEFGGFGFNPENARRPKFPEPVNLVFLLDQHRRDREGLSAQRPECHGPGGLAHGPAVPWSCSRSIAWRGAGFAISSPADTTATRPAGTGSSRTSRRCSTTMPSSPRFT